jgi:hypothetical protein
MTCSTCGTALMAADSVCGVCDPWGVTASRKVAAASARADAGLPAPPDATVPVPDWLVLRIRRNPPASADLDRGLRVTRISSLVRLVLFGTVAFGALFVDSVQAAGGYVLFGFAVAVVVIAIGRRVERREWLARAVAVVGTRPDIGYGWLGSLPPLARMAAVNKYGFYAWIPVAFAAARLMSGSDGSSAAWLPMSMGLVLAVMVGHSAACQISAAEVLRARLAEPPPVAGGAAKAEAAGLSPGVG